MRTITGKTEAIARAFSEKLAEWCGVEQLAEIIKRNKSQTDGNICHSHDFCDANMAMEAAFKKVLRRGCRVIQDRATDEQKEHDSRLWEAAWNLAKAESFFVTHQN